MKRNLRKSHLVASFLMESTATTLHNRCDFRMQTCTATMNGFTKGFAMIPSQLLLLVIFHSANAFSAMTNEKDRLLILGFGRVGQKVAQLVLADQDNAMEVMATTRKQATTDCTSQDEQADATTFKNQVQLVPYDQAIDCLNSCSHILISMPLDLFVDQSAASADLLQAVMDAPLIRWIGVISSTSVYGNHDGNWVTEDSECRDGKPSYLRVESMLQKSNKQVCIFRCAGIYGGQQSALHTLWKQGLPYDSTTALQNDVSVTNRIHIIDLTQAVFVALQTNACGVYNLADDEPASRQSVLQYAKELLERVVGVSVKMAASSPSDETVSSRSSRRLSDQKRVSNERMRSDLLPQLQYPTYREGLQAIVDDRTNPWWRQRAL
jgi:nucleoside-diphosphate-sugar epimerase